MPTPKRISPAGAKFMQAFEACILEVYADEGGLATCGWGHLMLPGDPPGPWTQEYADEVFVRDLAIHEGAVNQGAVVDLLQHEFDALVSFSFNVGYTAFERSTLLQYVNVNDFAHAACEFPRWGKVKNKWSAGLLRRRAGEQAIFLLADYSRVPT